MALNRGPTCWEGFSVDSVFPTWGRKGKKEEIN